jgi:hypothetical protein
MEQLRKKQSVKAKSECVTVKVKFFYAKTDKPDEFIDKMEQLCKEYCQHDFFFKYSIED